MLTYLSIELKTWTNKSFLILVFLASSTQFSIPDGVISLKNSIITQLSINNNDIFSWKLSDFVSFTTTIYAMCGKISWITLWIYWWGSMWWDWRHDRVKFSSELFLILKLLVVYMFLYWFVKCKNFKLLLRFQTFIIHWKWLLECEVEHLVDFHILIYV